MFRAHLTSLKWRRPKFLIDFSVSAGSHNTSTRMLHTDVEWSTAVAPLYIIVVDVTHWVISSMFAHIVVVHIHWRASGSRTYRMSACAVIVR